MSDPALQAALWGLAGSFIYGAPRLHTCLTSPKDRETPFSCLLEFAIVLTIGAIGAAAFTPWFAAARGLTQPRDFNAIAVIIGLVANPTAPILITFAPRFAATVFAALKGPKADEP